MGVSVIGTETYTRKTEIGSQLCFGMGKGAEKTGHSQQPNSESKQDSNFQIPLF